MQREAATATAVAVAATAAAGTAAVVSVRRVVQGGGGGGRQLRTYCSWPGSPPLLSCLSGIRSASNREPPRRSPRRGDAGGPVGRCCSRGGFHIASRCGTAMARRRGRPPASVRKAVLSAAFGAAPLREAWILRILPSTELFTAAVSAVRAVFRHRYRSRRTLIQNPLFTLHR